MGACNAVVGRALRHTLGSIPAPMAHQVFHPSVLGKLVTDLSVRIAVLSSCVPHGIVVEDKIKLKFVNIVVFKGRMKW